MFNVNVSYVQCYQQNQYQVGPPVMLPDISARCDAFIALVSMPIEKRW